MNNDQSLVEIVCMVDERALMVVNIQLTVIMQCSQATLLDHPGLLSEKTKKQ